MWSMNYDQYFKFSEHWSPGTIAQMNTYHFKLAKVQGEFVWHNHPETDKEECHILLGGPAGTIHTGDVVDEKTAPIDVWI